MLIIRLSIWLTITNKERASVMKSSAISIIAISFTTFVCTFSQKYQEIYATFLIVGHFLLSQVELFLSFNPEFVSYILFVNNRLDNFHVLRRKSIYNFLSRLKCSWNELIKNITESRYFSASLFHEGICENTSSRY